MSNIEKIKAEIERMHQEAVLAACGNDTDWLRSRIGTCVDILAFIDSLPEEDLYAEVGDTEEDYIKRSMAKVNECREMTCKESLQVQETCKENQDSLTSDLEEAAKDYAILPMDVGDGRVCIDKKKERAFIAGAKWMESQMPMPEDTVIFMKGVAEGRRLEREDRNDDNLPRYYGD